MRPCCGLSLQTGVEFIGLMDIINSTLITIAILTCEKFHLDKLIVVGIECISIFMGLYLIKGASKRCTFVCKSWIVFTALHSISLTSYFLFRLISDNIMPDERFSEEQAPEELIITISYLLAYKAYAIYVTVKFIAEINKFQGLNQTLVNLMDKDVEEFIYGTLASEQKAKDTKTMKASTTSLPALYDRNYEIFLDRIEIDPAVLGSGKFGKIHSGFILNPINQPQIDNTDEPTTVIQFERTRVAIKTLVNAEIDDIYFKSLLSELKIMIYLGEHPNVVSLIGVCTADIKKKNLWIILELCELGNLLSYLQSKHGMNVAHNVNNVHGNFVETKLAYKWSVQIAQALEYLESKHVVHGDVSARNILLTGDRVAKLSDFGLSRKIIQSKSSKNELENMPLPWRWMAIESLQNFEFSAKSDVWSYGVTLWEIFTLGATPFPNISWNTDFIKQLLIGSRLSQPNYAEKDVYDVMLTCWKKDPAKRPPFAELVSYFKDLLSLTQVIQTENEIPT